MALPTHINDREMQKFIDIAPGKTAVRVSGENFSGTFSVSGLKTGGRVTEVTINATGWTAIPLVPLANRNALAIQNNSAEEIKVNYRNDVGYVGMIIAPGSERYYDITDAIVMYARSVSSVVTINAEELA